MSDGFLSQEEIDSLLNGGSEPPKGEVEEVLPDIEKDLLGEVGNISMGSAATALSTIVNQPVNITTPIVNITTLRKLRSEFVVPNIAVDVKYISGIDGKNLLVIKVSDAAIIANLMMGGDGKTTKTDLSEIEISAVSEAMNQMIGSAATSMATMFSREVNISPPNCRIWDGETSMLSEEISEDEPVVQVSFRLTVGDLIDSSIMQIFPIETAKIVVSIMMGGNSSQGEQKAKVETQEVNTPKAQEYVQSEQPQAPHYETPPETKNQVPTAKVDVQQATFQPLQENLVQSSPKNIDLILDVPLEVSVVLGKTKRTIKDILNFGTGSLIELNKLVEEPVEILVNGKKVAYGEVVVVDENFGVRITSIVSSSERIKTLGQ